MTLRSRTNLMVEMARLLDEQDAARANGGHGHTAKPRRLLEA
jgi:hypothetical protein